MFAFIIVDQEDLAKRLAYNPPHELANRLPMQRHHLYSHCLLPGVLSHFHACRLSKAMNRITPGPILHNT